MNTQHTPGPWMIYDTGDIASAAVRTEDHTVIRAGNVKGATIGAAMANARLIAAAPELYAALRQAERVLALVGNPEKLSDYDAALSQVRAALAKVEGLTP